MYYFFNSQIWMENMLELNGKPSKCYHVLNWFFLPKPVFFKIYLNFQQLKWLKNQHLPCSEFKSYQMNSLNPAHQDLSINTKGTFQFLWNVQLQFNIIFSEKIIQYSKTFASPVQTPWNQANTPLLLKSFPKRPRTQSEASWFGGSRKYKQNKTNKLPSLIHRYVVC